jgi:hypothetical protein
LYRVAPDHSRLTGASDCGTLATMAELLGAIIATLIGASRSRAWIAAENLALRLSWRETRHAACRT